MIPRFPFPPEWFTTVTVQRRGPRDRYGKAGKLEEHTVERCLLAPGGTVGPPVQSGAVQSSPTLYRHEGEEPFEFTKDDIIIAPSDSWMPGTWLVDGRPKRWPFGWEVPLKREDAQWSNPTE